MNTENLLPEHPIDTRLPKPPETPPPSCVAGETPVPTPHAPEPRPESLEPPHRQVQDRLGRADGPLAGLLRRIDWRIVGGVAVVGISILVWWAVSAHAKLQSALVPAVEALPVPVARVMRQDLYNEVYFPAEFRPYVEVELHAKVSGYVREMKVDFGDQVKSNQLLATLEVPELYDELHNAIATQQKAEADYTNAHIIYQRLAKVNTKAHPNLVPQQDIDTAEAKDRTTLAEIAATKAEVEKYNTLVDYTRITAPFDGVVTKRYADPGALIQAGTASDTQSMPLVRVSDNYLLRLDFPVDQTYVKYIRVGDSIEVRVESLGGKPFNGTITRSTLKVTEDTRTMITEIEVPNPKLEIVPGMYCRVVLKVQNRPQVLTIPIQAVPPGYTNSVYVVNDQHQIEERPVTLGLDTPNDYEVTAGLKEGEQVLIGSRSRVQPGQKVEPKAVGSLAAE